MAKQLGMTQHSGGSANKRNVMTWNKHGFSSKGKDRMRARDQPNFKKSLQWRHSVTMVRRSSRNRCNDLLPSIFPALGIHLFARVCTPFVTTCVSGNRRSLVGCIRPHCFCLSSHLQESQTIHWCRLGQPACPTMQGASIHSIAAARSTDRGSESVTVRSEER
jgi:hypothetical protein